MTPAQACQINEWQATLVYKDGARGPIQIDCWGLVLATSAYLGIAPPYDSLAIRKASKQAGYKQVKQVFADEVKASDWQLCEPETGAVAFFGKLAEASHAGICLWGGVLDISSASGVRFRFYNSPDMPKNMEYARWVG